MPIKFRKLVSSQVSSSDPYVDAERQRAIADALRKQSTTPRNFGTATTGQSAIMGLTQLAEALLARRAGRDATQAENTAGTRMQARNQAIADELAAPRQPLDSVEGPSEQLQSIKTHTPESMAVMQALAGQTHKAANTVLAQAQLERVLPKQSDPFTLNAGAKRFDGKGQKVAENPDVADPVIQNWQIYEKPLPNGMVQTMTFDKTSNRWEKQGEPYKPFDTTPGSGGGSSAAPRLAMVVDPSDPKGERVLVMDVTSGRILGQAPKETPWGARSATRRFSAEGMNDAFNKAEELLSKGDPTASGIGRLADAALNFIGVSTNSAEAAADLDQLSAYLLTKVPKLKGSDSEKDRANYLEQVGSVGDRTKPVEQRLRALREAKHILGKYDENKGTKVAPADTPAAPNSAPSTGGLSPAEQAELDQLRARFKK